MSCAWVIVCSLPFSSPCSLPCVSPVSSSSSWTWTCSLSLPCGPYRGKTPLALRQVRSLALRSITRLSQVMNPTSSTISTTQRLLTSSTRNNPATRCPRTCMTRSSMTTPSAERSFHHCLLRSEKIQRAVGKLFTLLTKACCQVSRWLSALSEQGELFPMSLDPSFQTSGKIRRDSENEQMRILQQRQKSRLSVVVEQKFTNTSSKPIIVEEVSRNWM